MKREARVAICGRDKEQLERAAEEIRGPEGDVLPVVADVTRAADVERLIAEVLAHYRRINLLANCAGRSARGEAQATTPDDFQEMLEVNFLGAVRVTQAAMPHLLVARGHLINIGSLAAKSAARYYGGYPASKFALAAYTQQLRLELGPQGLKVLLACPGPISRAVPRDYVPADSSLPKSARAAGAGVKVSQLSPEHVAEAILDAAEQRRPELVLPAKARLLFVLAQISPRLGDWLVRRMT